MVTKARETKFRAQKKPVLQANSTSCNSQPLSTEDGKARIIQLEIQLEDRNSTIDLLKQNLNKLKYESEETARKKYSTWIQLEN